MTEASLFIERIFGRYAIFVRYLISGGISFGTNIVILYLLTEYFGVYYLTSVILAFLVAFVVSFFMMKHWTFQDTSKEGVHQQMSIYLSVAVFNMLLNTALVYLFVEYIGVWYIFSQFIASLLIAVSSFFIYKYLIFVKTPSQSSTV